jgi:hypothetical protein
MRVTRTPPSRCAGWSSSPSCGSPARVKRRLDYQGAVVVGQQTAGAVCRGVCAVLARSVGLVSAQQEVLADYCLKRCAIAPGRPDTTAANALRLPIERPRPRRLPARGTWWRRFGRWWRRTRTRVAEAGQFVGQHHEVQGRDR